MSGIPDPRLIAVTDASERPWLVLVSSPTWDQPQVPEIEAIQAPRLSVWMRLHSYLVPLAEAPRLREWAVGRDWYGLWMPGLAEPQNVLLGAHPMVRSGPRRMDRSTRGKQELTARCLRSSNAQRGTAVQACRGTRPPTKRLAVTSRLVVWSTSLVCTGEWTSPRVTRSEWLSATPRSSREGRRPSRCAATSCRNWHKPG